jgi:hypothetical protein
MFASSKSITRSFAVLSLALLPLVASAASASAAGSAGKHYCERICKDGKCFKSCGNPEEQPSAYQPPSTFPRYPGLAYQTSRDVPAWLAESTNASGGGGGGGGGGGR